MKTILIQCDMWHVTGDTMSKPGRKAGSCHVSRVTFAAPKCNEGGRRSRAFTIVELLVVIAIIGILAGLLLPVLSKAKETARKKQAAIDISQIVGAIQQYDSVYSRFPVSSAAQAAAAANAQASGNPDFTYGGVFTNASATAVPVFTAGYPMTNSEVMAILLDLTNYPNGSGMTINTNHQKNPQQTIFLNAKMSGWDSSQGYPPLPGIDNNLIYRDPWGNPYVITMDLSYDEQCEDAFYSLTSVSSPAPPAAANSNPGKNGLVNPDGKADSYRSHGKVMVWSAGPDGKIDTAALPGGEGSANSGVNKDNILSWQ
jgi:prepilin-type N-terminal cleavage/methylation domain-containing protein